MSSPGRGEGGAPDERPGLPPSVDVDLPPHADPRPEPPGAPPETPPVPVAADPTVAQPRVETVAAAATRPLPAPSSRPRERRPLSLANHALGRSEIAFLAMLAIGEVLAFGQDLIGGIARSNVTVARIGGLYVFGSLHVPIQLRATASGVRGTFLEISVALLTITAVGVVLLFRGGESVGDRAGGGVVRRGLWGAAVGVPFGLFTFLLSLLISFDFPIPVIEGGRVAIGVSRPWAAFLPLGAGMVLGALGGVWSGLSRAGANAPVPAGGSPPRAGRALASGAFAGAWRMFVVGLGLSFAGLLVLAGLHPSSTRAYLDGTVGRGASGIDLLVHHALALPNQSMFVLVPAMGGCDRVEGTAEPRSFLCFSKVPEHGSVTLTAPFFPGGRGVLRSPFENMRFGNAPPAFFAFLLIPLVATALGGVRAAKPAGSRCRAAVAGALAGVGFAALVVAGCLAAALTIRFYGGRAPASLTVWPDPIAGGLLGLLWGVIGGMIGAFAGWRPAVRKAPPPVPRRGAAPAS